MGGDVEVVEVVELVEVVEVVDGVEVVEVVEDALPPDGTGSVFLVQLEIIRSKKHPHRKVFIL